MLRIAKKIVKNSLHDFGYEIRKILPPLEQAGQEYIHNGRVPWSRNYEQVKQDYIAKTIADGSKMAIFRQGHPLPEGYGISLDERCIEYPWLFSQLESEASRLLDAGSVLNFNYLLKQPLLKNKQIYIMTLFPEDNCFWYRKVSYLYDDLRTIPFKEGYFDTIACISTLEHVGMDNTTYTGGNQYREKHTTDYLVGLMEIFRVLKPGGKAFVSVPFGKYEDHGYFQQFDAEIITMIKANLPNGMTMNERYYRYLTDGWKLANAAECAKVSYSNLAELSATERLKIIQTNPAAAAAAGSVACISFHKMI
jgi:SAM-dependent methyltransferase